MNRDKAKSACTIPWRVWGYGPKISLSRLSMHMYSSKGSESDNIGNPSTTPHGNPNRPRHSWVCEITSRLADSANRQPGQLALGHPIVYFLNLNAYQLRRTWDVSMAWCGGCSGLRPVEGNLGDKLQNPPRTVPTYLRSRPSINMGRRPRPPGDWTRYLPQRRKP